MKGSEMLLNVIQCSEAEELNRMKDDIGVYWTEYDISRFRYLMKKLNNVSLTHNKVMWMIYQSRAGKLKI
jgi:hypothetical protein